MMIIYTYSEARQNLARLLAQALKAGEVLIQRRDGQTFVVRPQARGASPLDVEASEAPSALGAVRYTV